MLYQPKVKDENVRRLYRLGQRKGRKMAHLINQAVEEFLAREESK